jgi:hypothetical protein
MDNSLTNDEYDALGQIRAGSGGARPSACVARNVKRLAGLKFVSYRKDGSLQLTEKAEQTLFLRSCIDGMRAIAIDPMAPLAADVRMFLGKKGHVVPREEVGFMLSQRGRESLEDIDNTAR